MVSGGASRLTAARTLSGPWTSCWGCRECCSSGGPPPAAYTTAPNGNHEPHAYQSQRRPRRPRRPRPPQQRWRLPVLRLQAQPHHRHILRRPRGPCPSSSGLSQPGSVVRRRCDARPSFALVTRSCSSPTGSGPAQPYKDPGPTTLSRLTAQRLTHQAVRRLQDPSYQVHIATCTEAA
jgi:hypothetical protein